MTTEPVRVAPTCPHCGNPLTRGGTALACGPRGSGATIRLPDWCADRQCRIDRDEAVIADAIARGVILP